MIMNRVRQQVMLLVLLETAVSAAVVHAWTTAGTVPSRSILSIERRQRRRQFGSSTTPSSLSPQPTPIVAGGWSMTTHLSMASSSSSSSSSGPNRRRRSKKFDDDDKKTKNVDFLDVEFEKFVEKIDDEDFNSDDLIRRYTSSPSSSSSGLNIDNSKNVNLIDLSFDSAATTTDDENNTFDPNPSDADSTSGIIDWRKVRIPFTRGDEYIDCKLAFTVEYEQQTYGIGIPFDTPVAIVIEEPVKDSGNDSDGGTKFTNVDPDMYSSNDDYAELMEVFAKQVQEQFGEQYYLRKTPKVLTISGGIEDVTKNWKRELTPMKPYSVEALMDAASGVIDDFRSTNKTPSTKSRDDFAADAVDPDLQEFYDFMRKELGDKEFEETMNKEDFTEEEMDLLKYFDVPGVGINDSDGDGMEDLLSSIMNDLNEIEGKTDSSRNGESRGGVGIIEEAKQFADDTDAKALKLLGYEFRKTGEKYTLVQFLQPITLVGRLCSGPESGSMEDGGNTGVEFELLTPQEEKVLIPKLESLCRRELEENGLKLQEDAGR